MRHGKKAAGKGDVPLTDEGVEQVVAAAHHHLAGRKYDIMLYSGMARADQTARLVRSTIYPIGATVPDVRMEFGFGYLWADAEFPCDPAIKVVDGLKAAGTRDTAALWLEHWRGAQLIRGRLIATLLFRAIEVVQRERRGEHAYDELPGEERPAQRQDFFVFAASHSPTAELASKTPADTDRLRETDICRYVVEVSGDNDDQAEIVGTEVIRAPY